MTLRRVLLGLCAFAGLAGCLVPQPDRGETSQSASSESNSTGESSTTGVASCGWDATMAWYACGFEGEDPNQVAARACAVDYTVGATCPTELRVGCCDDQGALWFCEDDGQGAAIIATETC